MSQSSLYWRTVVEIRDDAKVEWPHEPAQDIRPGAMASSRHACTHACRPDGNGVLASASTAAGARVRRVNSTSRGDSEATSIAGGGSAGT